MRYAIRRARTKDVRAIRALIDANAASGRLLDKATVTLYEDVQEFWVACDPDGRVVGCGALHVMWEDLAEIRTIAVEDGHQGHGVGHLLVGELLATARQLGVSRVFVLTFAVPFFARTASRRSRAKRPRPRSTPSCCAPTTRAWPSSWTWTGSSRTRWATPACCCG